MKNHQIWGKMGIIHQEQPGSISIQSMEFPKPEKSNLGYPTHSYNYVYTSLKIYFRASARRQTLKHVRNPTLTTNATKPQQTFPSPKISLIRASPARLGFRGSSKNLTNLDKEH